MSAPSKRGGKRPGAGRPVGTKNPATLGKEAAKALLRELVLKDMEPMVDAQKAAAMGLKYLVARNAKTGKFERVTQEMLDQWLDAGDDQSMERIEVWEKDPSVQAFTDLMNRAIDKPSESVEMNVTGSLDIVGKLQAARKRLKP